MSTPWTIAAVFALLLCLFAGSIYHSPTAEGQAPVPEKVVSWEYSVQVFDVSADAKRIQQAMNEFGDNGWEYTGVLNHDEKRRESTVVFKRAKK